jgi:phospholipase D1/2
MKMMYGVIANALREMDLLGKCHPQEFLNFYCLGNREVQTSVEPNPQAPPPANSKQVSLVLCVFSTYFCVGSG